MTRKDELLALADRVEALTGPSCELDRAIARLIGWHRVEPRFTRNKHGAWIAPQDFIGTMSDGSPILDSLHGTDMHREVPRFTASLDAAITLVPDGWRIYTADFSIKNRASWMLEGPKLERIEQEDGTWEAGEDWYKSGTGDTAALSLIVACLRAIASQEPNT